MKADLATLATVIKLGERLRHSLPGTTTTNCETLKTAVASMTNQQAGELSYVIENLVSSLRVLGMSEVELVAKL